MKTKQKHAPIEMVKEILNYKNKNVIERYCDEGKKSLEYGEEVFLQLMRWLYIAHILEQKADVAVPIYLEIIEVDYMWHSFILFTKDYHGFCNRYFNEYIHHNPATEDDSQPMEGDAFNSVLTDFKRTLQQEFGDEALAAWFQDVKYGVRTAEELRLMP